MLYTIRPGPEIRSEECTPPYTNVKDAIHGEIERIGATKDLLNLSEKCDNS